MSYSPSQDSGGEALWRAYSGLPEIHPGPGPCPSADTLAAYLDRRLEQSARAGVESHLAQCGQCAAVVAGAWRDLRQPLPCPSRRVLRRALGLLPRRSARGRRGVFEWSLWPLLEWSGAAAAMLMVCLLGFHLGETVHGNQLRVENAVIAELVGLETTVPVATGIDRGGLP